jgi:hypothetical protein
LVFIDDRKVARKVEEDMEEEKGEEVATDDAMIDIGEMDVVAEVDEDKEKKVDEDKEKKVVVKEKVEKKKGDAVVEGKIEVEGEDEENQLLPQ